jgi:hypothetical protein
MIATPTTSWPPRPFKEERTGDGPCDEHRHEVLKAEDAAEEQEQDRSHRASFA